MRAASLAGQDILRKVTAGHRLRLRVSVAHSIDVPSDQEQHQRLRIYGAYACARIALKAARFGRLRLPANSAPLRGAPRAAFERAAFSRGPLCPTKPRKVHGFQTKTKGTSYEQDRQPPEPPGLSRDQER
jgi:hypothetical protein